MPLFYMVTFFPRILLIIINLRVYQPRDTHLFTFNDDIFWCFPLYSLIKQLFPSNPSHFSAMMHVPYLPNF